MRQSERFRPRYHFTPRENWMNDPNGLVHVDGVYHLYYQHNPYGTEWGHMSWGHATSKDLVNWEHHPVAIWECPEEGYTIFSGSIVVDRENLSGFGVDDRAALVAIYTADHQAADPHVQDVHVASSLDGGFGFVPYPGNPVVAIGERKFGDPKVFWHGPTQRWIMVAICGLGQGHAVLYASPDLKSWTRLSEFQAPDVAPGVWECPDLFPLAVDGNPQDVRWVMKVNGSPFGGGASRTRFFLGTFDDETFSNAQLVGSSLTSDAGALYAEVTYNGVPEGQRILVGWLRQPAVAGRPWTGAQCVPRVLTLRSTDDGVILCQSPVEGLKTLRRARMTLHEHELSTPVALDEVDVSSGSLELLTVFDMRSATEAGVRLQLSNGSETVVGVDGASGELFVRSGTGERIASPVYVGARPVALRVLFDQEIVEAFVDDLAGVTTHLPYGAIYWGVEIYGEGVAPRLVRADAWEMG